MGESTQKEYYITYKDNGYFKVLSIVEYLLKKAIEGDNYPV